MNNLDPHEASFLSNIVSELAYGELRGVDVVRRCLENPCLARYGKFFERQASDEARHHRLFATIARHLPATAPLGPALPQLFDETDDIATSPAAVVAMHGILETLVLADLSTCEEFWSQIPTAKQLFASVARDERRHASFGQRWIAAHGRTGGVADCDKVLAVWASGVRECFERDDGLAKLTRRRRTQYLAIAERMVGVAAASQTEVLEAIGLSTTAREIGAISGIFR